MGNDTTKKPRICDILGVDVDEEFRVENNQKGKKLWLRIGEDGKVKGDDVDPTTLNELIAQAINHPEAVVRRPVEEPLSYQDLIMLQALKKAYPSMHFMVRTNGRPIDGDGLWLTEKQPTINVEGPQWSGRGIMIPEKLFPNIRPCEIVNLDTLNWIPEYENGMYFIRNSYDEYESTITGYFSMLEAAKEALKDCADWYRPKGTGTIYFQEFGLNKAPKKVYSV